MRRGGFHIRPRRGQDPSLQSDFKGVPVSYTHLMQTLPPDLPDEYANVPVAEYDEGN